MIVESAKYTESGSIIAVIDGVEMIVPDDMTNRHRQQLAEWEAQGNTIEPYTPPQPTLEDYERAIQEHIDVAARQKTYRNGDACATYAVSDDPDYGPEGRAFVKWRDSVWRYAYGELNKVLSGQRPQPTVEEFLTELPKIEWPE